MEQLTLACMQVHGTRLVLLVLLVLLLLLPVAGAAKLMLDQIWAGLAAFLSHKTVVTSLLAGGAGGCDVRQSSLGGAIKLFTSCCLEL
jgi:TM2 domain-containing membrane protein YozV